MQKPAGGAAVATEGSTADAIIEDARRYAVKTWSFALDRNDMRIEDAGMSTALV